jgi:hypothetical protein
MSVVAMWTCPSCGRRFGIVRQGHDCAPGLTLEEYFSTGPAHERPVFDAVHAHLAGLDGVVVEPVAVGIFFKRGRTFAQLRPMTRWVALSLVLPRTVVDRRISRKVQVEGTRHHHVVNLHGADDVDDVVRCWLSEAWEAAGAGRPGAAQSGAGRSGAHPRPVGGRR